jgi:hypothetical protein
MELTRLVKLKLQNTTERKKEENIGQDGRLLTSLNPGSA